MRSGGRRRTDHGYRPPTTEDQLVNELGAVFWEANPETFQYTFVSPAAERLLGFPVVDWIEQPDFWLRHVHRDDRAQALEYCLSATREGHDFSLQYRMIAADGSARWMHDFVRVQVDETQRTRRVYGVLLDITSHRPNEYANYVAAAGDAVRGVVHDFNHVLAIIVATADLLWAELAPTDPRRDDVETIRQAARAGADLTRQLLARSRDMVRAAHRAEINDIVRNVQRMVTRIMGSSIELRLELAPDAGWIAAESSQIEQVVLNLVTNARDAIPAGRSGVISISTANAYLDPRSDAWHERLSAGQFVELCVADTGIGMDEDLQARIFEPYFTTKGPDKGTGLGLPTVRDIAHRCGGHVLVESARAAGTTVRAYFPRM